MRPIEVLRVRRKEIKQRFGVRRIGVFGSFARRAERRRSDVDVLVEFEEGRKTFDNYMELKFFLERVFKRRVDLVVSTAIKPRLSNRIARETTYA